MWFFPQLKTPIGEPALNCVKLGEEIDQDMGQEIDEDIQLRTPHDPHHIDSRARISPDFRARLENKTEV